MGADLHVCRCNEPKVAAHVCGCSEFGSLLCTVFDSHILCYSKFDLLLLILLKLLLESNFTFSQVEFTFTSTQVQNYKSSSVTPGHEQPSRILVEEFNTNGHQ